MAGELRASEQQQRRAIMLQAVVGHELILHRMREKARLQFNKAGKESELLAQ
jgi:hypothetical protein